MDQTGPTQNPKKHFSKSTPTFLLFISHQSLFITIQIKKKNTTKQKKSFFYTKYSYVFSHINQICHNTSPLSQVQSIAKHSLDVYPNANKTHIAAFASWDKCHHAKVAAIGGFCLLFQKNETILAPSSSSSSSSFFFFFFFFFFNFWHFCISFHPFCSCLFHVYTCVYISDVGNVVGNRICK
jgi:hypothetical protein